jgi:hypothetical protein
MTENTPADDAAPEDAGAGHDDEDVVDFTSYVFPDPRQRRYSAIAFWILAVIAVVIWAAFGRDADSVVTGGLLVGGIVLAGFGAWFWLAAYPLELDQEAALLTATREIGFPVGHASANLGWRGWRARPTWQILLYSIEEPPAQRGMVVLDAVDGEILDFYSEKNPEDWDRIRAEEDARPG